MILEKICVKKTCSFYISDNHLSTLLLPYIKEKIKSNVRIKTFFENNIEKNIEKVTAGINMEEYIKKEILKINWDRTEETKCSKILKNMKIDNEDINVIVGGSKEYVHTINKCLENYIEKLNMKGLNYKIMMTINNCYPVVEKLNVKEILNEHDLLLNTSGEVEINSVFGDYANSCIGNKAKY